MSRTHLRTSLSRALAVAAALLLTATVAGCNASAGGSPESGGTASESTAAGGTSYPLTLPTPYGTSTLEARPERVAVVGPVGDLDNVLAVGVTPVFAPKLQTTWPWIDQSVASQIESTYESGQGGGEPTVPLEKVAASDPDVIIAITDTGLEKNYANLSKIAPVVALPDKPSASEVDWEAAIRLVGRALDRSAEAEEQITRTEDLITKAKEANPDFAGKSITFAVNYGADFGISYFNYAGSPAETFLTNLGFAAGKNASSFTAKNAQVSAEQIPLLDSDVLIVNYNGGEATKKQMETNKIFQQLTAVQSGHYLGLLPTDGTSSPLAWSLARPSAMNLQWSIEYVEPKLAEAVKGTS